MPLLTVTRELLDLLAAHPVFHKPYGGERWRVGDRLALDQNCTLEPYTQIFGGHSLPLEMGAFSYSHSDVRHYVAVGRYCSIGRDVSWLAGSHPRDWATTSPIAYRPDGALPAIAAYAERRPGVIAEREFPDFARVTVIGHDVWVGDQAMIRQGVRIGHGAIVGARALVLEDVAPYAVVAGSPARVLRSRLPEALAARFLKAAWWRFAPEAIQQLPIEEPARFIDQLEARLAGDPPPVLTAPRLGYAELLAASEAG
jgi:acetyltransferase-like isoleucine patch superfamily enzyme